MADRLISLNGLLAFMYGGKNVVPQSAEYTAISQILNGVSRRMATYMLRSPFYRLAETTSDGINSAIEQYGTEHYGRHDRSTIRLHRFPLISITSIFDNEQLLDASYYTVDYEESTVMRVVGKFFNRRKAVKIVYTAGFSLTGDGDTACLQVNEDLQNACALQCKYEFDRRQPGGLPPAGATTISRADGSIVVQPQKWLLEVQNVMDDYRRSP